MFRKCYILVFMIVALITSCQSSPPMSISTNAGDTTEINIDPVRDLVWGFRNSASDNAIIGVGVDTNRHGARGMAFHNISAQLNVIAIGGENEFGIFGGHISMVSTDFSRWLERNNLSPVREQVEQIGLEYVHLVEFELTEKLLQFPGPFMPLQSSSMHLRDAIGSAVSTMVRKLPEGSIVAIININAVNADDAEFVLEELSMSLSSEFNRHIVVARRQLDVIRREQNLQLSGAVSDSAIISIGQFLGANVVITGSITGANEFRRLRIMAFDVETAKLLTMANIRY